MLLLWVYVPPTSTVEKCVNRIYDRNEDGDMDITDSPIQLQNMYNRKSNTYAEHKIFPYAFVENVVTHADYRKKGYATDCLNYAKHIAKENNCYKMMLLTGSKEESTLNFYRNAGYNSTDKTAFIQWIDM